MKLSELIAGCELIGYAGEGDPEILDLEDSAKNVKSGSLFFAVNGNNSDGHDFAREAELRGASAVVCERKLNVKIPQAIVENSREALRIAAENFYAGPAKKLKIIGVTGTNGKTSVCRILANILENSGVKTGVIGTLGVYYDGNFTESNLTTPGTLKLTKIFYDMVNAGITYCVMEISAHAIDQGRIKGLFFETLIFTNCTEDHLDYFKTMERYSAVKESLFDPAICRYMLINVDDPLGVKILGKGYYNALSYGIYNPADAFAIDFSDSLDGIKYVANLFDLICNIVCPLIGEHNVYNTLAAASAAAVLGIGGEYIENGIKYTDGVKGRMERAAEYNGAAVYIDYAHTPDGLLKSLSALKNLCSGRLVCLFGCGGNREKEKRPVMGRIAGEIADFTVITSDNPRFEDPCAIISEIEKGIRETTFNYITVQDRREAMIYALKTLNPSDILIIAGKGAETYQEIMGEKHTFCDKTVLAEIIGELNNT